jgi:hypothetical protein
VKEFGILSRELNKMRMKTHSLMKSPKRDKNNYAD